MINFDYKVFYNPIASKLQTDAIIISAQNQGKNSKLENAFSLFKNDVSPKAGSKSPKAKRKYGDIGKSFTRKEMLASFDEKLKQRRETRSLVKRNSNFYENLSICFDSEPTGIFFINNGACNVINRFDGYKVCEI